MTEKKRLLRALIALTLLTIWGQSMMSAEASLDESEAVSTFLGTISTWLDGFGVDIRKAAHMVEYAVLAAETALLHGGRPFSKRAFTTLSFCGLAALIDETVQYIPAGRGPSVTDVWIDLAGALIGAAAMSLLLCVIRRRQNAGKN